MHPLYPYIILFDGVCNFCNSSVRFILKRDKRALFRFAAIQSDFGQSLIQRYQLANDLTTLYYFREGKCYRKSAAILYILKDLGGGWSCLFPLILIPAFIRDCLYSLFSRNRYKLFGKRKSCELPPPDIRNRFIK